MAAKTGNGGFIAIRNGAFLLLFVLILLAGVGMRGALAAGPGQSADEGRVLFQQQCSACHTIGGGDRLGPDLKGVTSSRDHDWLVRWLSETDKMLAEKDPIAAELLKKFNNIPMPNLGLSQAEVAALIAYLEPEDGGAPAQETPPASVGGSTTGDLAVGKDIFLGTKRLSNEGPSCRACHSIAGIGSLGGGAMGPDLTGAYTKLGEAVIAWPESVSPMKEIYSDKPLTPEEKEDLLAFLRSADVTQRSPRAVGWLALWAVAGAAVVLVAAQLVWRRRLSKVRGPMTKG